MTTKDLGIVRLVPKGDWSATVNYQYLNIVRYNGASYIATSASIGIAPDSSNGSTYWQLISQDVENAIQEELSVIENNVQNNANAIENQGTLIQNNANDIKNLFAITAPTYTEITVAQAYASRVTADGANIFDDQLTPVQEIAGSTVKTTNLFDISKMSTGSGGTTTHTDRDITVTDYFAATNNDLKILIPNLQIGKTYTFCCKEVVSDVELLYNRGSTYIYSSSTGIVSLFSGTSLKKAITIDENLYNNGSLGFWGNPVSAGGGKVTWKDFQVLEGDWTNKEIPEWTPYFAGLKHANINSIVSTGKNLFDKSKVKLGHSLTNAGGELMDGSWFISDYIPVQEGQSITVSGKPISGRLNAFYDENKNFLQGIQLVEGTLVVPQGARYMRFNSLQTNLNTAQIEYGSTATSYEPYKQSVFQLPETVELGVFDKTLPQEGKIVRRGNRVVLTGQDEWSTTGVTVYTSGLPAYTYVGRPSLPTNDPAYHGGICNVGQFVPDNNTAGCYMSNNGKTLYFTRELLVSIGLLTKTDNGDGTYTYGEINADVVNGWKAWVKSRYDNGDPVMVEYFVTKEYETTETINSQKVYTAWNKGSETIVQGETDNSQFGAMPTVTQTYFGKVGE